MIETASGPADVACQIANPDRPSGQGRWIGLSLGLLVVYLSFFHLIVDQSPRTTLLVGIGFAHSWTAICLWFRHWFANRFEFGIHLILTADIQLEALVPVHQGYGFYFCALAFWSVFWIYHFGFAKHRPR